MSVDVAGTIVALLCGIATLTGLIWRFAALMTKTDATLDLLISKVERLERLEEKLSMMAGIEYRVTTIEKTVDSLETGYRTLELKVVTL